MKGAKVCFVCGKEYEEGYSIGVGGEYKFDFCSMNCYSAACKDKNGKLAQAFTEHLKAVAGKGNK